MPDDVTRSHAAAAHRRCPVCGVVQCGGHATPDRAALEPALREDYEMTVALGVAMTKSQEAVYRRAAEALAALHATMNAKGHTDGEDRQWSREVIHRCLRQATAEAKVTDRATPDRVADRPDRGEKAVTLSLYPNENGLWVWIAYVGDGEVEGSAKGAAGGFEYASDALADAMERFPEIVVRHAEAMA